MIAGLQLLDLSGELCQRPLKHVHAGIELRSVITALCGSYTGQ